MDFLFAAFATNTQEPLKPPSDEVEEVDDLDDFDDPEDQTVKSQSTAPGLTIDIFPSNVFQNSIPTDVFQNNIFPNETFQNNVFQDLLGGLTISESTHSEPKSHSENEEIEEELRRIEEAHTVRKRLEEQENHRQFLLRQQEEQVKLAQKAAAAHSHSRLSLFSSNAKDNGHNNIDKSSMDNSNRSSIATATVIVAEVAPVEYVSDPHADEDSKKRQQEEMIRRREQIELERRERAERELKLKEEIAIQKQLEREARLLREEQDEIERLDREHYLREAQELNRLRQEQDLLERQMLEAETKRIEQEQLRKLKQEYEQERKLREQQTKKISKQVQKQIDRQELARQSIGATSHTMSKELIQKITEVQVNQEIDTFYSKQKEEEYEKIRAMKVKEAEEIEAQKNSVFNWVVGGLVNQPTPAANVYKATVYSPDDISRSPFEKHLTDQGFRVNLFKYESTGYSFEEDDEFKYEVDKTAFSGVPQKPRKAIIRFDPSFNSLYLDVKSEGESIIIHFNIKRDIKKVIRGVRMSSSLYYEGMTPETHKYISIYLNFKMKDIIMEMETIKSANNVCAELINFVEFRQQHPTIEIKIDEYNPPMKITPDATIKLPTILPPSNYMAIFDIQPTITTKQITEAPKAPPVKSSIISTETVKGLFVKGDDDDDDDDDDEDTDKSKKPHAVTIKDKLRISVEWYQWVRLYPRTGILASPKYRLFVFGSNGRICYYQFKDDTRDDGILPGLEALRRGMWDDHVTLYELGYKRVGHFMRSRVSNVKGSKSSSEPYLVDVSFKDLSSLTFACDSELKWQDALISFKSFTSKDYGASITAPVVAEMIASPTLPVK